MSSPWPTAFSMIGASGATGETGAQGLGFNFRGSYNNSTSYVLNDIVINNDSTEATTGGVVADNNTYIYISPTSFPGLAPTSVASAGLWTLFVPAGSGSGSSAQGDTGATGATGAQGGPGISIYNGLEVPTNTGAQGDYFINNISRDIYTYSTGTWNDLFSPEAYFSSVRTNGVILSQSLFYSTITVSTVSTFTSTFMYTGDVANFTVPQGTTQITFDVLGGGGANAGGGGAYVSGTYAVQSGDSSIGVYVGQGGQFANTSFGATYTGTDLILSVSGGSAPDVSLSEPLNAIVLGGGGGGASGIVLPGGTIVAAGGAGGFFDGIRAYPGGAGGIESGSEPAASLPILVTSLDLASDVVDRGSNSQTVTLNGTVPFSTIQGVQCAYFNNNLSNYLSVPFTPGTGSFTLTYWFNMLDNNEAYDIFSLSSGASAGSYGINADTTTIQQFYLNENSQNPGGWTYPESNINKWLFIALSCDVANNRAISYLNGEQKGTSVFPGITNSQFLLLGRSGDHARAFNGYTAKLNVYNKALGAPAILEIYNSQKPPALPLILLRAVNYSGSGAWNDESGNGFNATIEDGSIAKNGAGNGIVLNGQTNWTFPNVHAGNAWTASVWYKQTGANVGTNPSILTQTTGAMNIMIGVLENVYFAAFYNGSGWQPGTPISVPNNTWINIQSTWDGVYITTYINGSFIGRVARTGPSLDADTAYRIGRRWDYTDYVVGEIGEVRIYNVAISQSQVTADYNASLANFPN